MVFYIIISIVGLLIISLGVAFLGVRLKKKKVETLIYERNNLDLSTYEGKERCKLINKRIDKLMGYGKDS